jgi:hypothetical protein
MDRGRVARSTVEAPELGGALAGAWPPATPEPGSSLVGAKQREGNTESPTQASPGLGRQCGDRAMTWKWQQREARQRWRSCFRRGEE